MKTVKASEFKAQCLALMDKVAANGEVLVITKNGRPVAELHPHSGGRRTSPFGLHAGRTRILADLAATAMPAEADQWRALSE